MRRSNFGGNKMPVHDRDDSPVPSDVIPVRLSLLTWPQAGLLAVMALSFMVYLQGTTVVNDETSSWSSPGEHEGGIRAWRFPRRGGDWQQAAMTVSSGCARSVRKGRTN